MLPLCHLPYHPATCHIYKYLLSFLSVYIRSLSLGNIFILMPLQPIYLFPFTSKFCTENKYFPAACQVSAHFHSFLVTYHIFLPLAIKQWSSSFIFYMFLSTSNNSLKNLLFLWFSYYFSATCYTILPLAIFTNLFYLFSLFPYSTSHLPNIQPDASLGNSHISLSPLKFWTEYKYVQAACHIYLPLQNTSAHFLSFPVTCHISYHFQ